MRTYIYLYILYVYFKYLYKHNNIAYNNILNHVNKYKYDVVVMLNILDVLIYYKDSNKALLLYLCHHYKKKKEYDEFLLKEQSKVLLEWSKKWENQA